MPAFLHLSSTSWSRRWILTAHPVAQKKHVTALIPPPPPLDSESIRMFRDGPLEKLFGGGGGVGNFWGAWFCFRHCFSCIFFCAFAWMFFRVHWRAWIFFHSIFPWYFAPFAYFSTSLPPPPTPLPPWLFSWLMVPPLKRQDHALAGSVH